MTVPQHLPPVLCRCCGAPCPIVVIWGDNNDRTAYDLCIVCKDSWQDLGPDSSRLTVYAIHTRDGWTGTDLPDPRRIASNLKTAWDATDDRAATPGSRAWVRDTLRAIAAGTAPHRDLPWPPTCQKARYPKARCGARSDDRELRATPAWQDLVTDLTRTGLVDLPEELTEPAETPAGSMMVTAWCDSFDHGQPLACVVASYGSRSYLYVDPYTGTAKFQTNDWRAADAAWDKYRAWAITRDNPCLDTVAYAVRAEARARYESTNLTAAHRWLIAALLPDGIARQTALAFINADTGLTPAELAHAAADVAGDATLAAPWTRRPRSWPNPVPTHDWVAWDI